MQWAVRGTYVASFRCCSRVQDACALSIVSCARRGVLKDVNQLQKKRRNHR